jgi:hypothetical protein
MFFPGSVCFPGTKAQFLRRSYCRENRLVAKTVAKGVAEREGCMFCSRCGTERAWIRGLSGVRRKDWRTSDSRGVLPC